MSTSIDIKGLVRFETGNDGASIRLVAEDTSGRSVRLTFPTEALSSLIMTLPQMVTAALARRRNDPNARLVYPLAESRTELSTDLSTRILTLKTPDGFAVSFAVNDDQFRELARAYARSAELRAASPTSHEELAMLPLLSLHAIAARRGDGLHPVLLSGLERLAAEVAAESSREPEGRVAVSIADRVAPGESAKPARAA